MNQTLIRLPRLRVSPPWEIPGERSRRACWFWGDVLDGAGFSRRIFVRCDSGHQAELQVFTGSAVVPLSRPGQPCICPVGDCGWSGRIVLADWVDAEA